MMRFVEPRGPLDAQAQVPGSKSITARALVCAALADGNSRLDNASDSDDTFRMMNALDQFGVLARRIGDTLVVEGRGGRITAPSFPIPVGNAGTTLRFLCSVAALAGGPTEFRGDPRMAERPMEELLGALRCLGVEASGGGVLPAYSIRGGGLRGGRVRVPSAAGSQFLSSLLLVAPYASADLTLEASGEPASRPYIWMTLGVMKTFGVEVDRPEPFTFRVTAGRRYRPCEFAVEPDASSASYLFAAAAIAGGSVEVPGIRRGSLQGDAAFPDLLARMGCAVEETAAGLRVRGTGRLDGLEADMNGMPDMVPTLAVVALFASGPTRIRNVAHLRLKESDRLGVLAAELRRCGAGVDVYDDGLAVMPAPLRGVEFDPCDDHRLAMSLALIGLKVPGVGIGNPMCVRKSFPRFWEELERLR